MTIIAGCVRPSVGTKALHLNGVSPELLWPTPYCSITGVAQVRLEVRVAVRVGIKVSVVMSAIITEAIRNPQARRESQSKWSLRAGEWFIKFVVGKVFVFIQSQRTCDCGCAQRRKGNGVVTFADRRRVRNQSSCSA